MIRFRYDSSGSIMAEAAFMGTQLLDEGAAGFYHGENFLCESVGTAGSRLIIGSIHFLQLQADRLEEPWIYSAVDEGFIDHENVVPFEEWLGTRQITSGLECLLLFMEFMTPCRLPV